MPRSDNEIEEARIARGRCTWTVIVWPLLCCRRCILQALARPQLIARAGTGGGVLQAWRSGHQPHRSELDRRRRGALFGARITREARPTACQSERLLLGAHDAVRQHDGAGALFSVSSVSKPKVEGRLCGGPRMQRRPSSTIVFSGGVIAESSRLGVPLVSGNLVSHRRRSNSCRGRAQSRTSPRRHATEAEIPLVVSLTATLHPRVGADTPRLMMASRVRTVDDDSTPSSSRESATASSTTSQRRRAAQTSQLAGEMAELDPHKPLPPGKVCVHKLPLCPLHQTANRCSLPPPAGGTLSAGRNGASDGKLIDVGRRLLPCFDREVGVGPRGMTADSLGWLNVRPQQTSCPYSATEQRSAPS